MLYEIGGQGLKPCSVNENETRNKLAVGTILQLNGYDYTQYVIVKNLGISERFPSYGATYLCINLKDYTQSQKQSYALKHISQKADDRIAVYITDEVKTPEEVLNLWEKSEAKEKNTKARQQTAEENRKRLIEEGRKIAAGKIPQDAKALIIAEHDQDESDIQTDYFNHRTIETVVLGYSKHTKDIFAEMRKVCGRIPETKHLEIEVALDGNGEPKTEQNAEYWHPKDEHREKYSMGAGYYLKNGWRDSTGWSVRKLKYRQSDNWGDDIYISLAKRCVL